MNKTLKGPVAAKFAKSASHSLGISPFFKGGAVEIDKHVPKGDESKDSARFKITYGDFRMEFEGNPFGETATCKVFVKDKQMRPDDWYVLLGFVKDNGEAPTLEEARAENDREFAEDGVNYIDIVRGLIGETTSKE
jgi:hypothetical protein